MIEKLIKFGKVEQCEVINNEYHILLSTKFDNSAQKTLKLMRLINNEIGKTYNHVIKMASDKNHFHYILGKKI